MELDEYLSKTKHKRKELVDAAKGVFNKTLGAEDGRYAVESDHLEMYGGPNPQGLKAFDSEVNHQLRRFFSPGLLESQRPIRHLTNSNIDDEIRKTYSRNAPILKKRQLVILPKDYHNTPMKIPKYLTKLKQLSASPSLRVPQEIPKTKFDPVKKKPKDELLLPILTTVGSHETRAKIYKYR